MIDSSSPIALTDLNSGFVMVDSPMGDRAALASGTDFSQQQSLAITLDERSLQTDLVSNANGIRVKVKGRQETVVGTAAADRLDARQGKGNNRLLGEAGDDTLFAKKRDLLFGGKGDDLMNAAKGKRKNKLYGEAGRDTLIGGTLDQLDGGKGADILWAGRKGNRLKGGAGGDEFWLVQGSLPRKAHTVLDFKPGRDRLGFKNLSGVTQLSDLDLSQQGRDLVMTVQGKQIAVLKNVDAEDLSAEHFIFDPALSEPDSPEPIPEPAFSPRPVSINNGSPSSNPNLDGSTPSPTTTQSPDPSSTQSPDPSPTQSPNPSPTQSPNPSPTENPLPGAIAFQTDSYTVDEGTGNATLTLQRTGGSDGVVSVDINFVDGSAIAPEDYDGIPQTITFADGVLSQPVTIPIVDDPIDEVDEAFSASLTNPSGGATLGGTHANIIIQDNDVSPPPEPTPIPTPTEGAVKIMAFGDSLTHGTIEATFSSGLPEDGAALGGYRTVLYDTLQANGFEVDFIGPFGTTPVSTDPHHAAIGGQTTFSMSDYITNGQIDPSPADVVLVMLGTNDILKTVSMGDPVEVREQNINTALNHLSSLIDQIEGLGPKVMVASIPPMTNNLAGIVDQYNAQIPGIVAAKAAQGKDVQFVDINAGLNANDVTGDKFHLSSLAFSKMGVTWYNALRPILPTPANNPVSRNTPLRIEAEDFSSLGNFTPEVSSILPDTEVIHLPDNAIAQTSSASTEFTFSTGTYDIVIGYFDEQDAVGQLQVSVGDDVLPTITLDKNYGSDEFDGRNYVRTTLKTAAQMTNGDIITLTGTSAFGPGTELVRINYIEFIPVSDE